MAVWGYSSDQVEYKQDQDWVILRNLKAHDVSVEEQDEKDKESPSDPYRLPTIIPKTALVLNLWDGPFMAKNKNMFPDSLYQEEKKSDAKLPGIVT